MHITVQDLLGRSFRRPIFRCLLGCILAVISFNHAHAGNITFNLSLNGSKLTLTQQGNSTAFYPVVLRMLPDGKWQALTLFPGQIAPAEMVAGAHLDFVWPEKRALESLPPFERIQPMMVRFFDQAGVRLGQISFFNQPPPASETVQADYATGQLVITPPSGSGSAIRSSWLLWAQEEGIAPIRKPIQFDDPQLEQQPPARHIEWHSGMDKLRINTGAGQPAAMLFHETDQGYTLQSLPSGGLQGRQQRSAWLDASEKFYGAAKLTATAAALLLLLHFVWARRKGGEA